MITSDEKAANACGERDNSFDSIIGLSCRSLKALFAMIPPHHRKSFFPEIVFVVLSDFLTQFFIDLREPTTSYFQPAKFPFQTVAVIT
jgi:hypothetical protein